LRALSSAVQEFKQVRVASSEDPMCLAVPAQIRQLLDDGSQQAVVDILGVRRKVNVQLLGPDPPRPGEWVLIHVGFAMSKISAEQAAEQLDLLRQLREAGAAREELGDGEESGAASLGERSQRRPT
jgi:hydrogenase expression/formation protein HypC